MKFNCEKVSTFFDSIKDSEISSYDDYWSELKPQTNNAVFRRYLFAFMSVHTSWQMNCKGYNAIKQFNKWAIEASEQLEFWNYDSEKLFKRIERTRVGMQNNRTNYIGTFSGKFWGNPDDYIHANSGEGWTEWRDRLCKEILGLGKAKTSFAIEMLFPTEAKVVCMDTHLFQVYGCDQRRDMKKYEALEADWIKRSDERGIAPYMARCLYWDKNQNRKSSRYWSKVLEA
jgi:hypothetical protein